ncbi:MAG: glycosyltransferase [Kouleothrix sp.]|nr:glycosyltransferase [Kouleothrix sp.]
MRVLYAIPRYGQQFISNETHGEVVRELNRLDLNVDVLSFTTRSGAGGPGGWGAGFGSERVYRHVQGARLAERLLAPVARRSLHYEFFFSLLAGYLQIARPGRYDLVHVEGSFPLGAIAALASRWSRTPYVVTTTGGDLFRLPDQGYGYGHYRLPRYLIGLALRRAAWVRANSTLSARLAIGYGASAKRTTVLPVSIAGISYPPGDLPLDAYRARCRAALGQRYGWDDTPLIVCVGRLIGLKAPELLIDALPQICAAVGPVRICIIGPTRPDPARGDYLTFLQRRAAELGVEQLCTFTGYVPLVEIRDYLAAADLLAVPSLLEGLNRVVIEAAAVGTASVISDGAGAAELVGRYGCGLITPAGDGAALGQAIGRLLASRRALSDFGANALALARDCSAAAVAQGLARIYADAARGSA